VKKILALSLALVLAAPAFAVNYQSLQDAQGNIFVMPDPFGTFYVAERAGSLVALGVSASCTSLEKIRVALVAIQAGVDASCTGIAQANTTLSNIHAGVFATATGMEKSRAALVAIQAAVETSATELQAANATLTLVKTAVQTGGTELQAANTKLAAINLATAASATSAELNRLQLVTLNATTARQYGNTYSSTPFVATAAVAVAKVIPTTAKFVRVRVRGTASNYVDIGLTTAAIGGAGVNISVQGGGVWESVPLYIDATGATLYTNTGVDQGNIIGSVEWVE